MIRKTQLLFKLGLIVIDLISIALILAFYIGEGPIINPILASLIAVATLSVMGGYHLEKQQTTLRTTMRLLLTTSFAMFLVYGLSSIPAPESAMWIPLITYSTALLLILRMLFTIAERAHYKHGKGQIPIIVIGYSRAGEAFLREVKNDPNLARFRILGFLDNSKKEDLENTPYLGKLITIEDAIKKHKPEAVIQVGVLEQSVTVTTICQSYNLEYHVLPALLGAFGKKVTVNTAVGRPLITVKETNLQGWGFALKRVFDIFVSALLLILLAPVWIVICITLIIERKSFNIITKEQRIDGRTNLPFNMLRFRTLKNEETEVSLSAKQIKLHSTEMIVDKNLASATKIGAHLRRTELNELPQLLNVLKNSMSLIGPRAAFADEIEHYTNFHKKRLRLKPGITGLWQVEKDQTDGLHDDLLKKDIWYVENWSLELDLVIIFKTAAHTLRKITNL
jgi:lipopolysaccharide/colanic/teichoic acid biosynthesis glycosyltransferase